VSGATTNPGLYPGNPSLPREVRDKILSTFRHTLNLYQEGKLDDCVIGCDFILKMDPRFGPARRLLEKAKNPAADVDLIELEAIVATTPARSQRASAADAEKLLVRAVESLNARDFDACINAAEQVLTALPGNVHAGELIEKARRKKEVLSEFEASRTRALALLEARRHKDAGVELERMRSLDPEHPAVSLLERRISQAGGPVPAAAADHAPELGGMMDFGAQHAQEPQISFSDHEPAAAPVGGLDSLSLDSLSLDAPEPTAVLPPPDFPATRRGPLDLGGGAPGGRGTPGDLWSEGGESTAEPLPPPPPPRPAPAPRAEEEPGKAEREIDLLLKQGDDALARGDHEGAIEIWSRIFLIDINSVEAVTRIENARQTMAEGDKRVQESLRRGTQAYEAGDLDAARTAFLQTLAIQGNEPTARSYLDKIEKEVAGGGEAFSIADIKPQPEESFSDLRSSETEEPEPAPGKTPAARPSFKVNPKVALIAAAFVGLVAIGSWLVLRQPKPAAAPPPPVQAGGSLEKATAFFQEGRIPETIAELKRIRPSDPDFAKARQLLETLDKAPAGAAPATAEGQPPAPPGASDGADPSPIRARAEQALSEKRYIDALKDFSAVSGSFQGDPAFAQSMTAASDRVTELTPAVKLYNEGEYETAIPVLWRIYQSDKGNQDARSYLLRCYANQGITQLQNGLYDKARQSFDEALALAPQDPELMRHRKFADRYQKGDLDLLGRIYVRHLSHQP
jgi:tetratricopeptide (TPR) repeat protein